MSLMEVKHWGKAGWKFMHAISFGYPDNPTISDRNHATNFFKSVGYVLPCKKCRSHYNEQVKKNPPDVESKDSLSRWLVAIHNEVNRANGKREWSHEEVKKQHEIKLEDASKQCTVVAPSSFCNEKTLFLVVAAFIVVYFLYNRSIVT